MRWFTQSTALLCCVIGAPSICGCQIKIPLQDVSDQGSPICVSGQLSLQDDPSASASHAYRFEGTIANVSSKAIVLSVIHFWVRGGKAPGLDTNLPSDDHFFGPKDLQPGEEEMFPTRELHLGTSTDYGPTHEIAGGGDVQLVPEDVGPDKAQAADARVEFVQFVDGSTWGDTGAGRGVIAGRNGILQELIRYESVLNEEGTTAFLDAFASRHTYLHFPLVFFLIARCKAKPDSCIVEGMHSMVQAAMQHQVEMKPNSTASDAAFDRSR